MHEGIHRWIFFFLCSDKATDFAVFTLFLDTKQREPFFPIIMQISNFIILQKKNSFSFDLFTDGNSISINSTPTLAHPRIQDGAREGNPCRQHHVNMESSQFINQTRLSKKQLQLHVHQQNQKYFLDSPHDNYQQSRCQYFTSVTTPPSAHFPPPPEYPNIHHQPPHQTQQNHCVFEQISPSHRRPNIKKFHQPDPNGIEVCSIDYENQHNNHVGGVDSSVSDVLNQLKNLLFLCSFIHRNELNWLILNNTFFFVWFQRCWRACSACFHPFSLPILDSKMSWEVFVVDSSIVERFQVKSWVKLKSKLEKLGAILKNLERRKDVGHFVNDDRWRYKWGFVNVFSRCWWEI